MQYGDRLLPDDLHGAIVGDLMAYMGRRRISQRSVASMLGVDQSTVSRWFNKDMSVADLDRVLAALGLTAQLSFRDAETGEVTLPFVRPVLVAAPGGGHRMAVVAGKSHRSTRATQLPLMHSVPRPT